MLGNYPVFARAGVAHSVPCAEVRGVLDGELQHPVIIVLPALADDTYEPVHPCQAHLGGNKDIPDSQDSRLRHWLNISS